MKCLYISMFIIKPRNKDTEVFAKFLASIFGIRVIDLLNLFC